MTRNVPRAMGALLIALGGCGGATVQYVYRPTEQVKAAIAGFPAAHYEIPPEEPRGKVDVTTFGITKMQVTEEGAVTRFIHVRLVVANNNDIGPWFVDTRAQLLVLPGEGKSRPAFVNTDVRTLPTLQVTPGGKRTVDLYYALPATMQTSGRIPAFDVLWNVATATRVVAERTPFERLAVEPDVVRGYYPDLRVGLEVGWAPVWWYDPLFLTVTFAHPVVVHRLYPILVRQTSYPPRRIFVVAPPPSRHRL